MIAEIQLSLLIAGPLLCRVTYTLLNRSVVAVVLGQNVSDTLALISLSTGSILRIDSAKLKYKTFTYLQASSEQTLISFIQSEDRPGALVQIDVNAAMQALEAGNTSYTLLPMETAAIKRTSNLVKDGTIGKEYLPPSEEIEFPTTLPVS